MKYFAGIDSALVALAVASTLAPASSFAPPRLPPRASTRLHLENHIAEMIDEEVLRLNDLDGWRRRQEEKRRRGREETSLPQGFDFNSPADIQPRDAAAAAQKIQRRKDRRMARTDPAQYCADRCVATGNCEVWEEMFDMAADEVQKFCNECVLSEEEEPCEVPEKFIANAGKNSWEIAP